MYSSVDNQHWDTLLEIHPVKSQRKQAARGTYRVKPYVLQFDVISLTVRQSSRHLAGLCFKGIILYNRKYRHSMSSTPFLPSAASFPYEPMKERQLRVTNPDRPYQNHATLTAEQPRDQLASGAH